MIDSLRLLFNRSARRQDHNQRGEDFLSQYIRWRRRRQGMEALHGMPDYLLKDIGISRAEIDQAARGQRNRLSSSHVKETCDGLSGIGRRQKNSRAGSARRTGDPR